jgi:DNA-binding transcriptional regulator YiaG
MKYKSDIYDSDIAEMVHENAMLDFKMGFISEAQMRKFDKLCLTKKAYKAKTARGAAASIEHAELITA